MPGVPYASANRPGLLESSTTMHYSSLAIRIEVFESTTCPLLQTRYG